MSNRTEFQAQDPSNDASQHHHPTITHYNTIAKGHSKTPSFLEQWYRMNLRQRDSLVQEIEQLSKHGLLHPIFPDTEESRELIRKFIYPYSTKGDEWWARKLPTLRAPDGKWESLWEF